MIEVRLKVPNISIFIVGDLGEKSLKKMSELFIKPDINVLVGNNIIVERSESAPYDWDFKNAKKSGTALIPASNIAYMKVVREG